MRISTLLCATIIAAGVLFPAGVFAQNNDDPKLLAQELLEAIRLDRQIDRMTAQVAAQTSQFMRQSRPEMTDEEAKVYGQAYAAAIKTYVGDLVGEIAKIYAREYSVDELKQITAFYRSPVGQKYLDLGPQLSAQAVALGQAWQQKNEHAAQSMAAQEMHKRGFKNW
jgi:hypothetical protein